MEDKNVMRELRERTGMSRKEFCAFLQIPYRTVTEWERGTRHAPEYVVRLLCYYLQHEGLLAETTGKEYPDEENH